MTAPMLYHPKQAVLISEDFTSGGSSSSAGPNWTVHNENGRAGVTSGVWGPTGGTDGRRMALHTTRMKTDNMFVQALMTGTMATTLRSGLVIRGAETPGDWIALLCNNGSSILCRGTGTPGWQDANVTVLATWASFASGNTMRLEIKNDVYQGFKNGTSLGTYSATRPYAIGSTQRRVGMQCARGSFQNSCKVDNFTAGDLAA